MDRTEAIGLLSGLMFKGKLKEALEMAIASLETDEAYQLQYEKPSGKWEQINKNEHNVIPQWKCSECGAEFECFGIDFEYCPRCGSKMVWLQESEDKDQEQ